MGVIAKAEGATLVKMAETTNEGERLLAARKSALAALSRIRPTTILEDATVPRSKLAEMVEAIERIAQKYNVQICTFGHAGGWKPSPNVYDGRT